MYLPFAYLRRIWRKWKILIIILLFISLLLWSVLGIYVFFYPLGVIIKITDNPPGVYPIPCVNPEEIELIGTTLFLGDIHLTFGEDSSRLSGISQFILSNEVKNLIVVGDLFNSPQDAEKILGTKYGVDSAHIILNSIGLTDENIKVYFVKGFQGHDPTEFDLNVQQDEVSFRTMGKCARFFNNKTNVTTIHGDDAFGGLHGFIFSQMLGKPFFEAWWKDIMNIDDEEWVIMGHSHSPGIDYSRRVANTGGWTNRFGFEPSKGQGILLINEEISLVNVSG